MGSFWDNIQSFFLRLFQPGAAQARARVPEKLSELLDTDDFILSKIAMAADSHYSVFHLWKDAAKTKQRQIEAPTPELKRIQRLILRRFLYTFEPSFCSHGFVRDRSIITNAALHTGRKFVVKLDLKDFFPSVSEEMIWKEWKQQKLISAKTEPQLRTLLRLCLYRNRLPQGAPTSPALANIVCRKLDHSLAKIARRYHMEYSRYADDLTFSGDSAVCYRLIPVFKKVIAAYGFTVNEKKVNVLKQHQRQTVTGLVVNLSGHTAVKRRDRMKLRAYMHQILTGRIPPEQVNLSKLHGHVSFIRQADPVHGVFFADQLEKIEKMFHAS